MIVPPGALAPCVDLTEVGAVNVDDLLILILNRSPGVKVMNNRNERNPSRGAARSDLVVTLALTLVLVALVLPALAQSRGMSSGTASNANLWTLGMGHAIYSADWNGRQYTAVKDDISTYGNSLVAFNNYTAQEGMQHPGTVLGWGFPDNDPDAGIPPILFAYRCDGNLANASLTLPINFTTNSFTSFFGSFRMMNARGFRQYVASRFYSEPFYAPDDVIVRDSVDPLMEIPFEYADAPPLSGVGDLPRWSSYCMSPAAMFHPDVMRHPNEGGWQDPWQLFHGFESPSFFAARHPSLKTFMLEHHWIQNAPAEPCNPAFRAGTYDLCEPYYFNHAMASAPHTLFYDLSVRMLPNSEVHAADQAAIMRTGEGLWSRDTAFGANGYFNDLSFDDVDLSHHILTTDGILGRDTTAGR